MGGGFLSLAGGGCLGEGRGDDPVMVGCNLLFKNLLKVQCCVLLSRLCQAISVISQRFHTYL
jgi:hypothetical protein